MTAEWKEKEKRKKDIGHSQGAKVVIYGKKLLRWYTIYFTWLLGFKPDWKENNIANKLVSKSPKVGQGKIQLLYEQIIIYSDFNHLQNVRS